jgi:6-phosphofructokinase 1
VAKKKLKRQLYGTRNEKSSDTYTTNFLTDMLREEGAPLFDSRSAQMGHTLQGGTPTPRDRGRAVRLAVRSVQFLEQRAAGVEATGLENHVSPQADTDIGVLVVESSHVRVANLREMAAAADGKHRRAKNPWWLKMKEVQVSSVLFAETLTRKGLQG